MTDMQKCDGAILRTDARGRVHTPKARQERLLEEFARSGLSGPKFAKLAGIKYQTFAAWVLRRRQRAVAAPPAKPPEPVRWLEAVVEPAATTPNQNGVALLLPGGARLELSEPKQLPLLVALLRALERPC
jgi:hypothetical protein